MKPGRHVALTTLGALMAAAAVAAPAQASEPPTPASAPSFSTSFGDVTPAGGAIRRKVTPRRGFRIVIPKVGSLRGPRRAVSSRGTLVIRPYRASLTDGLYPAGFGVDVVLRGAKLKRRLTLTQRVRRGPAGTVPLIAHRARDGSWDLRRGRLVRGRHIRVRTKRFSINIPTWLNPKEWAHALGRRFAASIGGRTSPWECPLAPPQWFWVVNKTSTVHACGTSNNDDAGERAELRIKSNRGAVLQVTLAGPRVYAWVNGQPDRLRSMLGAATGTDPSNVVFLPKGDDGLMTVGYRQPASTSDYTLLVETTYDSVMVNLAYFILDLAVGDAASSRVKYGAVGYALTKCSGVLDLSSGTGKTPADAVSGASFTSVLACLVEEAAQDFRDPRVAFNIALELNDPSISRMTTQQFAEQLTRTGGKLMALGWTLTLRPLLQQGWQGIADTAAALFTDGTSTHIDITLDGRPAQSASSSAGGGQVSGSGTSSPPASGGGQAPAPPTQREVVIYNKVTNGPTQMREDDQPAYLSTVARNYCKRDGCALAGTDMWTGHRIVALCQTAGVSTTNGWNANSSDDANPGLYTSTRWYLMRWADGRTGYLSEVWVAPEFRGGMGLPGC